jgi:hypothetical protein
MSNAPWCVAVLHLQHVLSNAALVDGHLLADSQKGDALLGSGLRRGYMDLEQAGEHRAVGLRERHRS